jgi:hypothetical protein
VPLHATAQRARPLAPVAIIQLATVLVVVLAFGVMSAFPNSADEFGYTYLADMLRHGRLWNASFPASLRDVLMTIYVPDQHGKRFSQYPPGWLAILALFPSLRLSALANPILGLFSAVLLLLGLKEMRTPARTIAPLLVPTALAPSRSSTMHSSSIIRLQARACWPSPSSTCARILRFYAVALWRRAVTRTLRWFDLIFLALVLFFVLYPDGGGFQYGSRYWFAGWVLMPLTLGAWFANGEFWRSSRLVVDPVRLGNLQAAFYLGFTIGYAVFCLCPGSGARATLEGGGHGSRTRGRAVLPL